MLLDRAGDEEQRLQPRKECNHSLWGQGAGPLWGRAAHGCITKSQPCSAEETCVTALQSGK